MLQSRYFTPTLREDPAEATNISHNLMLRAGLVRQLSAGVFSFLPLGYKVIKKIIEILREEIDNIGGQEFLLPALNPIEIWEQTGRVAAMGDVMFHIKNRDGLVLAPTHEEIITYHARQHVKSYRDLPQVWYQIQTKFRNEPRPKSGVLRGRQFIMKDSYSMDSSWEGLDVSYQNHLTAYKRIFDRCGLKYFIVGASSGAMGGRQSQEFMIESDSGEDTCVISEQSGYAANLEVATSLVEPVGRIAGDLPLEIFPTPKSKTIDDLVEHFGLDERRCAKSVVYIIDSQPVLIFMRGNDELNETKLQSVFGTNNLRPAESEELVKYTGADHGSIGPINLKTKMKVVADLLLKDANGLVSGANKDGYHYKNIDFTRDCTIDEYHDFRTVREGESCPDGTPLKIVKAIELGHIFKLGTKYSDALGATFLDSEGKEHPIIMGSYGIGVERILACFIEQHHDEKGIIWEWPVLPFHVHLLALNLHKDESVSFAAESVYKELMAANYDVLYDDRNESPGIKFNDADLLGIPIQVIVGSKNIKNNQLEIKNRKTGERSLVDIDKLSDWVHGFYNNHEG